MIVKRTIYRLGFRPSRGPLYSPSLAWRYAGEEMMQQVTFDTPDPSASV